MAMSLSGSTRYFLKLSFHMLPYNQILKVFKSKIWVDIWKEHPKIPLSTKFRRNQWGCFWSQYEHLKFRPMHQLKYRLWRHNDVIVVMSRNFCYHCVEYIKLDTCAKFHDHQSNNNKVMIGGALMPPHNWRFKKSPYQIGLIMVFMNIMLILYWKAQIFLVLERWSLCCSSQHLGGGGGDKVVMSEISGPYHVIQPTFEPIILHQSQSISVSHIYWAQGPKEKIFVLTFRLNAVRSMCLECQNNHFSYGPRSQ